MDNRRVKRERQELGLVQAGWLDKWRSEAESAVAVELQRALKYRRPERLGVLSAHT